MRLLVVTAVDAERVAALRLLPASESDGRLEVVGIAGGVGPVAAAVTTARALASLPAVDLVVSAGIAGGFGGRAGIGDTVLGDASVFADLGALTDEGFLDLASLGLAGGEPLPAPGASFARRVLVAAGVEPVVGTVLTLATMTGTEAGGSLLAARHPDAVAEAMEGYGVATAAAAAGIGWVELRTVSNLVGRRDRSRWDLPTAVEALGVAVAALAAGEVPADAWAARPAPPGAESAP